MAHRRLTTPGFRDHRYRQVIDDLVGRRKALQMTQQALAERLGLHKQFVSRYELGERRLDLVEFSDVARALGLSPEAMVAEIPNAED